MNPSIFSADIVLTMNRDNQVLENGGVCVDGNLIAGVGTIDVLRQRDRKSVV